ncbi:RIP metalloprotease RseP [Candidatus Blochmanniella vafra str. BVAF]|uniref:Zinc metalloprotease n=1 Tax=Blochmanniella vafra (strain BVAF) TaxID=859654 RepID=E8Q6T2_BLOVB|nr:RIP metalloprotease RseP [Candidatus Blochmannia vafer]ADV33679.1 RIP metalloprotease RseP [Candidatus Blochmannia vafer str. BVAF]
MINLTHFFWNTVAFVITIGILITVHEFGHFLAARFFQVKVERLSIGFGPVLWSWTCSNGTEYTISAIPLGGYIKLLDTPSNSIFEKSRNLVAQKITNEGNSFHSQHIWKRSIIIAAGPIFNFIFAILIYTITYSIGIPINKPIINYILPNSIFDQSGIPVKSEIKSVNNIKVSDWESARFEILNNINKKKILFTIQVTSDKKEHLNTYTIYLPTNWFSQSLIDSNDPLIALGIFPDILHITSDDLDSQLYCFNSQNLLEINDKILLINKQPIYNWEFLTQTIQNNAEKLFQIVVERNERLLYLDAILGNKNLVDSNVFKTNNYFFLRNNYLANTQNPEIQKYELHNAILKAFNKTKNLFFFTVNSLRQLISGDIKITNLHGPIAIAQGARQSMYSGLHHYLMFLAIISINLGIINFLPFPVLDGGQLCLLLIEKITGAPLSKKVQNFSYMLSLIILICITIIALYNDIV